MIFISFYYLISISSNPYRLIRSSAYTEKAFKITKEELLRTFLTEDTQSVSKYGLSYTGWIELENPEKYITETYKKMYNGEHRYICYFYLPSEDNKVEPTGYKDERVYYYIRVQTDKDDHVIQCGLFVWLNNNTIAEKNTLNGYFGTTLPGEFFSIACGKEPNHVISIFKEALDSYKHYKSEGNVRFINNIEKNQYVELTMAITYKE